MSSQGLSLLEQTVGRPGGGKNILNLLGLWGDLVIHLSFYNIHEISEIAKTWFLQFDLYFKGHFFWPIFFMVAQAHGIYICTIYRFVSKTIGSRWEWMTFPHHLIQFSKNQERSPPWPQAAASSRAAVHRAKAVLWLFIFGFYKCYMGVSKNKGTPKWMVDNGKPY